MNWEDKLVQKQATTLLAVAVFLIATIAFIQPAEPSTLQPQIEQWTAHPMYISQLANPYSFSGYTPNQTKAAYHLPDSGGDGTTIAIIDAFDTPSIWDDLGNFSAEFGLPAPTSSNFEVHKMSTSIGVDGNWSIEACLDVEWAHAIAPDAKILLVEATSANGSDLLDAVDYARNRSDVVAVSMSWGGSEFSAESYFDSWFTSNYGAIFFASSGDDGAGVSWPSSSPNVVAVGGTTLNLDSSGNVISETAWSGSGGGMSAIESRPAYQTSYGLTMPNRAVPDVSYNANPSTGFRVYSDSHWYIVGGTSAGAPQWAAIFALGLTASNTNIYQKAKTAYSSYFRDITSGSNGYYSASSGYDYVTGLGSPLTADFGVKVFPVSGPPGGLVTVNGTGFTAGSSVNISYLNPLTSTWVPVVGNLATPSQTFSYDLNAPDMLQNNTAGDHQPLSNGIIFRAQDNSNGQSYYTTIPYTEWCRGLIQVSSSTATGLYGNNTDLTQSILVENGEAIPVAGEWFNPGNVSLLWDDITALGTTVADENGFFNATVLVPTTSAGPHTLVIQDNNSIFSFNLTRLPNVDNDFVDKWYTSDISINLTAEYAVNEILYRINNGSLQTVVDNGQPTIMAEGSNNTLEYWGTWNNGTAIIDLPHTNITGIKLDKTPPSGTISTNPTTATAEITLALSATDVLSGVAQMRFSNDGGSWSNWETYATSKAWTLQGGDGVKTVYVQYSDNAGLESALYSCTVTLQTPQPKSTPQSTVTPTATPTVTPTTQPSATVEPSPTPAVPELGLLAVLVLMALSGLLAAAVFRRRK